ncbi:hypothetical protein GWK47_033314 [Chionoecetes opilio]|uniref:Uncharacterized protein n=1 Tax=Chionoecetes opilio TaxID=41210 RepID=A0A8J4YPP5_CHIOP|nr:hypothetical protein GWK47_033314 [Chionoecetes opilio]
MEMEMEKRVQRETKRKKRMDEKIEEEKDNVREGEDVSSDEVIIDKLKDLWSSRRHAFLASSPTRARLQDADGKIEFAVTPQDQRYYHPPTPSRHDPPPPGSDLLNFLSPDLNLQPPLDYPGDLLQYQEEDLQYPSEYAAQYQPQYRHRSVIAQATSTSRTYHIQGDFILPAYRTNGC